MNKTFILLIAAASSISAKAQSQLASAAADTKEALWSLESIASGTLEGSTATVSQGFITPDIEANASIQIQLAETGEYNVYPNPVTSVLHIDTKDKTVFTWQLTAIDGKTTASGKHEQGNCTIDCNSLVPGEYILTIIADGNRQSSVIIKE